MILVLLLMPLVSLAQEATPAELVQRLGDGSFEVSLVLQLDGGIVQFVNGGHGGRRGRIRGGGFRES